MITIFLVVLMSSSIFITFKIFNRFKIDNFQAITVNYFIAFVVGIFVISDKSILTEVFIQPWILYAIITGVLFIVVFLLFSLSSQKAGIAITAVFSKMSVIIPVILGVFLYNEQFNTFKIIGGMATLFAFILIFYKKNKKNLDYRLILFPVLIFIGNGMIDSTLKYAEYHFIQHDIMFFLTTIFAVAFSVGAIVSILRYVINRHKVQLKNVSGGVILGLLNFGTTYFYDKSNGNV
ncbi:MAG: EamA/RhaT family transporter [Bacteroidetes bacterium]|nr:EamA/RhaT family transporter [Bacteroidota bacterium]